MLGHGMVEVFDRVSGRAELADEGVDQEGMGGDEALIGGQRGGALDGLEARVDDVGVAPVMVAEEALQGSAAGELDGVEGRPLGEKVAEEGSACVVKPLQDVREVVLQGTSEAMGEAHVVADQAAALCDEWRQGTHLGALGGERCECVAMREQELAHELSVGGIVCGVAGRAGFAVRGQGQRVDGEHAQKLVLTQGVDHRTCVEFKAHRDGVSCEPRS